MQRDGAVQGAERVHVADSHEKIRGVGAWENNLQGLDVEVPKRGLTAVTGVLGEGKSSLVCDTLAVESAVLVNETYSALLHAGVAARARPQVDVMEGLTPAIIDDQNRMGSAPRSTVGAATDVNAM